MASLPASSFATPTAWLLLAVGGALGAVLRYLVAHAVQSGIAGARAGFPWGTLVVNVLGSFAFGLLFVWITELRGVGDAWQPAARFGLLVGFLGAFTTFSTFAFETAALLTEGRVVLAVVNVFAQNCASLLAVLAGIGLGRSL